MLNKVVFRISIAIILFCVIFLSYICVIVIVFNRDVAVPSTISNYKQYYEAVDILRKELYENTCNFTNEEYRKYIEEDLKLSFYIYKEVDLNDNYNGKAYPIIRTIFLDKDLKGYIYCQTFVHEAIHIKQCVADETYVCYETFKYLYEDEVLHNVGVVYGWQQMNKMYKDEYNIQEQVIYYLTQK